MPDHPSDSSSAEDVELPEPSDEMIALYLAHVPEYLSDFRSAIQNRDQEQLDFLCHKMCSAMRLMGFDNIAVNLESIKDRDVSSEEVRSVATQIEAMIDHTYTLLGRS